MSLIKENTINNSFNSFIDWRIIKNNIGCFATEL